MYVLKRNGKREEVSFDKITSRIKKLCYGLNDKFVDPVRVLVWCATPPPMFSLTIAIQKNPRSHVLHPDHHYPEGHPRCVPRCHHG